MSVINECQDLRLRNCLRP